MACHHLLPGTLTPISFALQYPYSYKYQQVRSIYYDKVLVRRPELRWTRYRENKTTLKTITATPHAHPHHTMHTLVKSSASRGRKNKNQNCLSRRDNNVNQTKFPSIMQYDFSTIASFSSLHSSCIRVPGTVLLYAYINV